MKKVRHFIGEREGNGGWGHLLGGKERDDVATEEWKRTG